jgi:hypothetical protein
VYVIVEVPDATPITTPLLFTVTALVFDDDQGVVVDGFVVAVKLTFEPTHIDADPVMLGNGLTVTIVVLTQPLLSV